jgi:hypothetical protein
LSSWWPSDVLVCRGRRRGRIWAGARLQDRLLAVEVPMPHCSLGTSLCLRRRPAPVEEAAAALMVGQEQHAALRLGAEEGACSWSGLLGRSSTAGLHLGIALLRPPSRAAGKRA